MSGNSHNYQVGEELTSSTFVVTQSLVEQYAEVSGDHNPIHLDSKFAATTRYGGRIAHGMLGTGFIMCVLSRYFGTGWDGSAKIVVKFKAPVKDGDSITVSVTVRRVDADKGLLLDVKGSIADGTTVIVADATLKGSYGRDNIN